MKPSARKRSRPTRSASKPATTPQVIVLAAGVGSRMRSRTPKVLHRVGGRPLIDFVLDAAARLSPSRTVVVLGPFRSAIEEALSSRSLTVAVQDPPLGTGDAVRSALPCLAEGDGDVVVLSGDAPLLSALVERRREGRLDLAFLSFRPPDPGALGRVVRDSRGRVTRVVEAKNAGRAEARIREVNAGVYCFAREALERALSKLARDEVSGEYYLTDAIGILASRKGRVDALEAEDWREAWGINTRAELAAAEEILRRRAVDRALASGVTILDPATARIGPLVRMEPDVVIHPFVSLEGETSLAEGCEVLPFTRIVDSRLEAGALVGSHSDLEGAVVGARSRVGPFARLRPGTVLGEDVRVGNFVETKKAVLGRGVKASLLSPARSPATTTA